MEGPRAVGQSAVIRVLERRLCARDERVDEVGNGRGCERSGHHIQRHIESARDEDRRDVNGEVAAVGRRQGSVRRPDGECADIVRVHAT